MPETDQRPPAPDTLDTTALRLVVGDALSDQLGEPPTFDDDADLITHGLDSITMMRLAGRWRRDGHDVAFADLAAEPTLRAWAALLAGPSAPIEPAEPAPGDPGEPFPLAGMQHAYLVGRGADQLLGGVAAHFYHEFDGPAVDPGRLQRAVAALFARHDMLRARFTPDGRQYIAPDAAWTCLAVHDLRDAADAEEAVARRRDALSHRMLDVARGEVLDVQLTLLPGDRSRLHVNLDMLVADAVSFRTLLADLAELYAHPDVALPPIGYSYRQYRLAHPPTRVDAHARDRAWWQARVPDLPGAPDLPLATPMERIEHPRVVRRHFWLDGDRLAALGGHARRRAVTPAMALTTCFAEVIAAWSAEPRFLLNVPMFGREQLHPDVDRLVGDFTGSVLLEIDTTEPATFAERAAAVARRFREDAAHPDYTGVEVLRDLTRARGRQVLAPVVLTSALNLGELYTDAFRRHFGAPSWIVSQGPQVWLDAQLTEVDGGLLVNWDALEQAFGAATLDAMFGAFQRLVEALAAGPDAWDRPVGALLPEAARGVRARCNDTGPGPAPRLLHDSFFARAATHPCDAALLADDHDPVTYDTLADRALRIAGALTSAGVTPGAAVAISLPKGPAQAAAVLGVLAAGGVYVPVGVEQPVARRRRIGVGAAVAAVLTDTSHNDRGWPEGAPVLDVAAAAAAEPLARPAPRTPEDAAYILYTSGSTGEPKGVVVSHRAAWNTIGDLVERFAMGPGDRTLALSALDFDLSVFDLVAPLSVVPLEEQRRDAQEWRGLCDRHGVTVLNCVPQLLGMLLDAGRDGLPALRLVLLGGDKVGLDLPGRLAAQAPAARFVGLGGTTETAIHSTLCEVGPGGVSPDWLSVPYGTPLRGVALRVVDRHGRDCPDHVTGELWIGGGGVADGYRGDPARTAAAFVVHEGRRCYRTGDLARYAPDGTVEFLGRADAQVKVRGHRIELGEVEAALEQHPGVEHAVAAVTAGASPRLVAGITGTARPDELHAWLTDRLPPYMVADPLTVLASVPLSANGKLDRPAVRRALASAAAGPTTGRTPPRGPVEEAVAAAWSELLGCGPVGRDDGYFALGGDSLIATRVLARLRADRYAGATIGGLFARPVLAEFAATLHRGGPDAPAVAVVADPAGRFEPFAPTDVQRAYWVGRRSGMELGGIGCHFYREYDVPDLDVPRLEAALDALVARHDALRTVFDGRGEQRVLREVPGVRVPVIEGADAVERLRAEQSHRVFDPAGWPLFSVTVARAGPSARVAIGLDNLVLDALSVLILYSELGALYSDPAAALPPVGVTFRDYLRAATPDRAALAAAREYWTARLAELPPAPQLPLACAPSEITSPRFTRRATRIDAADWAVLRERAATAGLTPSAVLLAAFGEALSQWSANPELTVNLTLFDRRDLHPDVPRILGDFTSLMLVGYRSGADWVARARAVQAELSRGLDHREVSAVALQREIGATMPVVFTSALGVGADIPPAAPFDDAVYGVSQTPQVWLDHQVTESHGGVDLSFDAVEELFPPGLLDALVAGHRTLVAHLVGSDWAQPLPDLRPAGQRAVRAKVNDTAWTPGETRLHAGVFRHAAADPTAPALIRGEEVLTRGELADRALRVAALLRDRGIGPGDPVAVTLPKGPDQIVALLGVLAAGGAYVPVGLGQPAARRERIHRLAGTVATLTARGIDPGGPHPVFMEDAAGAVALPEPVAVDPDQLAYVIFTSGSTGEPKGVEVTHRAAANTVADIDDRFGIGPTDRVLAVSAYDFDLSVYDVFGLLGAGGVVVGIAEDERRDARRWAELVRTHGVTVWNTVPALLDMLLVVAEAGGPLPSLRVALLSGDWVGLDLPGRLAAVAPGCRFVALGGATEAAIWSNSHEVGAHEVGAVDPGWRSIPYGRPLRGQRFRVVDPAGRDRPDHVPGELWIGGTGVARGYRGAPAETARAFVEYGGERWYRTGDQGRYGPDGVLEFLGRTDHQVKIRGHRIELGEVEAALGAQAGVAHAVAVVVPGGAGRLVAAVVPSAARGGAVPLQHPPAPVRWASVDREAVVAEAVLVRLLLLHRLDAAPVDLFDLFEVAVRHRPVIELWLRWLARREVVRTVDGLHTAGPRLAAALGHLPGAGDDLAARAGARLVELLEGYRAVLAGRAEPVALLLDDPVLAPERLADADPGTGPAITEMAAVIRAVLRAAAGGRGGPIEVVEVGGRSGLTALRLLDLLGPDEVRYTLLDPAASMVAASTRLLAGQPATCRRLGAVVDDELRHRFDVVIAHNAWHGHPDPADGPALAALLARPGAPVLALERVRLTPIALLTAALLDGGYTGLDPQRRVAGSPTLDGTRWAAVLATAGFADVRHRPVDGSPLTLLRATLPMTAPVLDTAGLRAGLHERLPAHMVPERVTVLARLPLTANGKVDRAAVTTLLADVEPAADSGATDGGAGKDEAPAGELEDFVATTWAELLGVSAPGRADSFFLLGGDSLVATRFLERTRARLGLELPLRRMFAAPTVAQVAASLADLTPADVEEGEL